MMRDKGRAFVLAGAAFISAAAAMASCGACIVVPPAEVAIPSERPPRILRDSVVPRADMPLTMWPDNGLFIVPVTLDDQNEPVACQAFLDYTSPPFSQNFAPVDVCFVSRSPSNLDGGVAVLTVTLPTQDPSHPIDLDTCHRVEVLVARKFASPHVPDSVGADSITWVYGVPGAPYGCSYDAGDGAFAQDGPSIDGLPIPPVDGAGP